MKVYNLLFSLLIIKLVKSEEFKVRLTKETLEKWGYNSNSVYMDLSNQEIETIDGAAFQSFTNLETLILSFNHLAELESNTFQNLNKLTYLSISHNLITRIHPDLFKGLTNLINLDMDNNQISTLPQGLFLNTRKLFVLILSYNNLIRIEANTFSGLNLIKRISLDNNKILVVDRTCFIGLVQLQEVLLFNNPYTLINPTSAVNLCSSIPSCVVETNGPQKMV
jgi:Leucine-rich repeat (LRR) protein